MKPAPRPRSRRAHVAAAVLVLLVTIPAFAPVAAHALPALAWTRHADAPLPAAEVAVAAVGPRIHMIAGLHEPFVATTVVQVYDASEDAWSFAPPYPLPVHHHAAVTVDDTIYVFGGFATAGYGPYVDPDAPDAWIYWVPTDQAFKLEPGADAWVPVAPLPEARGAHAAAVVGGKVYVVGGIDANTDHTPSVHVYDPATDAWSTAADLPNPRDHLGAVTLDGKLIVTAGRLYTVPNVETVDVYDPATDAWSAGTPLPEGRGGAPVTTYQGHLFVIGGEYVGGIHKRVDHYDPVTDAWATAPDLPDARHGGGAAEWNDRLYVLGGVTRFHPFLPRIEQRVESLGPVG